MVGMLIRSTGNVDCASLSLRFSDFVEILPAGHVRMPPYSPKDAGTRRSVLFVRLSKKGMPTGRGRGILKYLQAALPSGGSVNDRQTSYRIPVSSRICTHCDAPWARSIR